MNAVSRAAPPVPGGFSASRAPVRDARIAAGRFPRCRPRRTRRENVGTTPRRAAAHRRRGTRPAKPGRFAATG